MPSFLGEAVVRTYRLSIAIFCSGKLTSCPPHFPVVKTEEVKREVRGACASDGICLLNPARSGRVGSGLFVSFRFGSGRVGSD